MIKFKGIDKRKILFLAILAALSLGAYLLASVYTFRMGFPLDDAWIHQTYARNLGENWEWAFISGVSSSGSTAPLWSGILAVGYAIRIDNYAWAYFVGWVLFWILAVLGAYAFRLLSPENDAWALIAGMLIVFEWHLVWAAASGMETLLFSLLMLFILMMLFLDEVNWVLVGVLSGLTVWIRPDGITMLGPALLVLILNQKSWTRRMTDLILLTLGFAVSFIPYILFNQAISGMWWPNTFYAKQAEYAIELKDPLWFRIFEQVQLPMIGVGILLLPGFIFTLLKTFRRRQWPALAGAIWAIGFLMVYAFRLPVTYQHGRYIIPMIPVYLIWSFAGLRSLYQPRSPMIWRRVVSNAWILSTTFVLIGFWILGARAYAMDVSLIESEMVKSAQWIAINTDEDSIIAAHDIGALGYFSNRALVDLAGLVSPEVIPFIRDEVRLAEYLNERGAEYLVTFPGWYPKLVRESTPVFRTNGEFSPAQGGENMVIYKWNTPMTTP
jgi:hypothetical protein